MTTQIINGKTYWQDAHGRLIAEELVKEMDKECDGLVRGFVKQAQDIQANLRAFKNQVFDDVAAFVQLSAEKYEVKIGGRKGNLTLFSFDGKYKLQVAVSNHIRFDEKLQAGKVLIDECLHEWVGDSRPELKALIENAFQVDKEDNLSTTRILSLRRIDIQDARWTRAMQAISDSVQIVGSKDYVRFYERDEQGKYQPITLDMAGV